MTTMVLTSEIEINLQISPPRAGFFLPHSPTANVVSPEFTCGHAARISAVRWLLGYRTTLGVLGLVGSAERVPLNLFEAKVASACRKCLPRLTFSSSELILAQGSMAGTPRSSVPGPPTCHRILELRWHAIHT